MISLNGNEQVFFLQKATWANSIMDMNTSLTFASFIRFRVQHSPGKYKFVSSSFLYIVGSASTKLIITSTPNATKRSIIFPTNREKNKTKARVNVNEKLFKCNLHRNLIEERRLVSFGEALMRN
jgi:hypothetical protein